MRRAVARYEMVNDGLGVKVSSQSVQDLVVSIKGLSEGERAAVVELVGCINDIPREEAEGEATDYRRGLYGYAVRMLGPLWRELRTSNWKQAKKMLAAYVARREAGFRHDDDGRADYEEHLAQGMSYPYACCAALVLMRS